MSSPYLEDGVDKALELAFNYAQVDGDHHKMWVIDQMIRALLGIDYEGWIYTYEHDGEDTYTWDTGIAP